MTHRRKTKVEQRLFNEIFIAFERKCYICGCDLTSKTVTRDHVFPKSLGFPRLTGNMAPACQDCNNNKGDNLPSVELIKKVKEVYAKTTQTFAPIGSIKSRRIEFNRKYMAHVRKTKGAEYAKKAYEFNIANRM